MSQARTSGAKHRPTNICKRPNIPESNRSRINRKAAIFCCIFSLGLSPQRVPPKPGVPTFRECRTESHRIPQQVACGEVSASSGSHIAGWGGGDDRSKNSCLRPRSRFTPRRRHQSARRKDKKRLLWKSQKKRSLRNNLRESSSLKTVACFWLFKLAHTLPLHSPNKGWTCRWCASQKVESLALAWISPTRPRSCHNPTRGPHLDRTHATTPPTKRAPAHTTPPATPPGHIHHYTLSYSTAPHTTPPHPNPHRHHHVATTPHHIIPQ